MIEEKGGGDCYINNPQRKLRKTIALSRSKDLNDFAKSSYVQIPRVQIE